MNVFCKSCVKNMLLTSVLCPIDKYKFSQKNKDLPCCYAIFTNLPRNTLGVSCPHHYKKKVKFMCKGHSTYLCTECIIEHTGHGHEIVGFNPNLEEMNRELHILLDISQELIAESKENLKIQQQQDKKISTFYDHQMAKSSK